MGQKLTGEVLPAEAACGDSVIDVSPDESVLILIKHCRDMKQQETRLRLTTLLVLLSCMALILFTTGDLRQQKNSASREQGSAAAQNPAYSKQERVCPGDLPTSPTTSQRWHIHLRSLSTDYRHDKQYLHWEVLFGENYNEEEHAIVIPQTGFYFVYVRIALRCSSEDSDMNFTSFFAELHTWNKNYNKTLHLMKTWDGVLCTPEGSSRNVFVGQLFELLEGTHVSVWISEGYRLITKSSFGAYLT